MTVEFGDLPPSHNRLGLDWVAIAARLRANPGQWAKVHTSEKAMTTRNAVTRVRQGVYTAFRPAGSFEATSRGADLWVRYVGGSDD